MKDPKPQDASVRTVGVPTDTAAVHMKDPKPQEASVKTVGRTAYIARQISKSALPLIYTSMTTFALNIFFYVNNCPTRCDSIGFLFPANCSTRLGRHFHTSSGARVNCNYSIWHWFIHDERTLENKINLFLFLLSYFGPFSDQNLPDILISTSPLHCCCLTAV
jgi:hypothetical protein